MPKHLAILLAAIGCAACGVVSPSTQALRENPHGHLVWAARNGDVTAIRSLVAAGVDPNDSSDVPLAFVFPDFDHRAWTALQHAVARGQVESVRVLLESGAKPDARREGTIGTPLIIALVNNKPAIAQMLVAAGADIGVSKAALSLQEPGGPAWHFVEHTMARVTGRQSPSEALDRLAATLPPRP